jgi:hypothetical protein
MIDATLLFKGASVFTPWFPRQGDVVRVTAECVVVSGATLTIRLFGKNSDDPGDGTDLDSGTTIALSTPGQVSAEWKNPSPPTLGVVKQLVRFKLSVAGSNATDWILYRILPACWFDALTAS